MDMNMKLNYTQASVGCRSGELLNLNEQLYYYCLCLGRKRACWLGLGLCVVCVPTSVKPLCVYDKGTLSQPHLISRATAQPVTISNHRLLLSNDSGHW